MNKFDKVRNEFEAICTHVSGFYDLSKGEILRRNKHDCVEARYVIVYILCERYRDDDIAKAICVSKSVVNKIRNSIQYKTEKKKLSTFISEVKKELLLTN